MKDRNSIELEKTRQLLGYLHAFSQLRRDRSGTYRTEDRLIWFHDIQELLPEVRTPMLKPPEKDGGTHWLEMGKPETVPAPPPVPEQVSAVFDVIDLEAPDSEPELRLRNMPSGGVVQAGQKSSREDAIYCWKRYLEAEWKPWAEKARRLQKLDRLYSELDFIRGRAEEAEEQYELVLAVGLLVWRAPENIPIYRHLLTAPAEILFDPRRALFCIEPAASFDSLRVELDMLDLQYQPALEKTRIHQSLEELADRVWDRQALAEILQELGYLIHTKCSVFPEALERPSELPKNPCIYYAPALVLRRRHLPSYERLVLHLRESAEQDGAFKATKPWLTIIREGEADPDTEKHSGDESSIDSGDSRLYFPLPTNEEQRSIVDRLRQKPAVLVKGPPGTGKSHTIANLICNLLARGERVLVTAQAPKALDVLLGLLPEEIRALCLASLGSGYDEQQRLNENVNRILAHRDSWPGQAKQEEELRRLERDLGELEQQAAQLDRRLREIREAECHIVELQGGYSGTAAAIAQKLHEELQQHGWIPRPVQPGANFPLEAEETMFLADFHAGLTETKLQELNLQLGPDDLPSPQTFRETVQQLAVVKERLAGAEPSSPESDIESLRHLDERSLESLAGFLSNLQACSYQARNWLGPLAESILQACLKGQALLWQGTLEEAQTLVRKMGECLNILNGAVVEEKKNNPVVETLSHAKQRLDHFRKRGWKGWKFIAPAVVRQTRYIEHSYLVEGHPPAGITDLEKLVAYLEFKKCGLRLQELFPGTGDTPKPNLHSVLQRASRQVEVLERILQLFSEPAAQLLDFLNNNQRSSWENAANFNTLRNQVQREALRRRHERLEGLIQKWNSTVGAAVGGLQVHPCVLRLAQGIRERNADSYAAAFRERQEALQARSDWQRYRLLLEKIRQVSPAVADELLRTQGASGWREKLVDLPKAWKWAQAMTWLQNVIEPGALEKVAAERSDVEEKIRARVEKLAAMHAWNKFLQRMDDATRQNLVAWQRAMKRLGKGTGIHAERHRRTARNYMMQCLPVIPAWIMPLYRVWEMVEARPGLFDTVIVDEASQAGTEALLLLLLAKRIVVVGDDMQNSPEAVGVPEHDIVALGRQYLGSFHFQHEYRPDVSFYDHCLRAFGNPISLKEHFRCVPEIIRFSNELCYSSDPLIPLRQAPLNRLAPLVSVFVKDAVCEGEGQKIRNEAEADAIVKRIQQCLEDARYGCKSIGVIVLQGHAQAELIEGKLAKIVPPQVRMSRKIRCGVPATFQGDQRDVIFLSLVVAPNHRFRALTEIEAIRRFNVAMSRARDQVFLFHSVQLADLSKEDLRYRLLNFFLKPPHEELHAEAERLMAACARTPRRRGNQPDPYESWFEVDVALELLRRGYRVRPQMQVSNYRIDLVLEGAENRLAVECDGDEWHGPDRFEQDLYRQRQLERAGWRFVRVRASEFYANRSAAIDHIVGACAQNGIRPITSEGKSAGNGTAAGLDQDARHVVTAEDNVRPIALNRRVDASAPQDRSKLPEMGPTANRTSLFPDPREAPRERVAEALLAIIRREKIVNKRRLYRLYVQGCHGVERAGGEVRRLLNRALLSLQRPAKVEVRNYDDKSLEFQEIRLSGVSSDHWEVREVPRLEEIPPSVLFQTIDKVLTALPVGKPSEQETLESWMRAVLDHFRITRLTTNRKKFLAKAFALRSSAAKRGQEKHNTV